MAISKMGLTENRSIITPYIRVHGNCLEISNTCIQLSNISMFSTSNISNTELKDLIFAIVLTLIGGILTEVNALIGLAVILAGAGLCYLWYRKRQSERESKRLSIITNAGISYSIVFKDEDFLREVVTVLTKILRDPDHESNVAINLNKCCFMDSASAIGNVYEWK